MNKYTTLTFLALLILILALPIYAWLEPTRMAEAQADLRQEFVSDAAVYICRKLRSLPWCSRRRHRANAGAG